MTKKDQFIEKTVRKLLAKHFAAEPDESLKAELIKDFSTNPIPASFETRFGEVTIELSIANLITKIVDEMNARLVAIPLRFKDGDMDVFFEEEEGLKAGLDYFTEVAAIYFLTNLKSKSVSTLNLFFEESLSISIMAGQAGLAKKIGDGKKRIPADIDVRSALKGLKKQETIEDGQRIARALDSFEGFEGLKVPSNRGRPRTWTKASLDQVVRKASIKFKKDKYRPPTLSDVAAHISRLYPDRMQLNAKSLGQMLKRYELEWKDLKNPQI